MTEIADGEYIMFCSYRETEITLTFSKSSNDNSSGEITGSSC